MKVAGVLVLANVTIKGANFGGLERRKNVVPIRSTSKVGPEQKEIFGVIPVSPNSSLLSPGHSCCRVGSHRKSRNLAEAETATGPWLDVL